MDIASSSNLDNITWSYITESAQKKHDINYRNLYQFIQDNAHLYITEKGDSKTNIIDQREKKTYALPINVLHQLYNLLEKCRLEGSMVHFSERQVDPSGLMLDFDILTTDKDIMLTEKTLSKLTNLLINELKKDIELKDTTQFICYTIRQNVDQVSVTNEKNITYKFGFHIIIPGILLDKIYKKLFLQKLSKNLILKNILTDLKVINIETCLDQNSASVPVLFLGSCKLGSKPYTLEYVFEFTIDYDDGSFMLKKVSISDLTNYNLVSELSLTMETIYEEKTCLIKKTKYNYRHDIQAQIDEILSKQQESSENLLLDNSLSILNIHDPEARYIYTLLDILPEEYYTDRNKWRNVIYALSNKSKLYKPLAVWFSQKCPEKWNNNGQRVLDELWEEPDCNNPLTIASISYWAKMANPDKYYTIMNRSYFTILTQYIYNTSGELEHYPFARVLYAMLCNKYIADIDNTTSKKMIWYEFVLPGDTMKYGEVWKWRKEADPINLKLYVSEKLPIIMEQIISHFDEQVERATTESRAKYFTTVRKLVHKYKSKLYNNKFKSDIVAEASLIFFRRGFTDQLDSLTNLFGVANGIIKIGSKCELINYYHEYPISRFTPINYTKFDENNPMTQLVLNAIADIIVEVDVRNWILYHAAQGLSRDTKEGLLLLMEGGGQNGKTSLLRWISKALGPYADKFNIQLLSSNREEADKPNSAMMRFKHINWAYAEESNQAQVLNVARMKELVNAGEISGRDLHSKQETFTITCNFVVASQYSFIINTTDHGTWRRLKHYTSKVKFCSNPDPNNIYEKKENQDFNLVYSKDPKFLSSMLSILTHYYEMLHIKYNGQLKNVPCPTLDIETEKFRTSQDTIHKWICECIVISPKHSIDYDMSTVTTKYMEWYKTNIIETRSSTITPTTIKKDIMLSAIGKYFTASHNSIILKGCRFLTFNDKTLKEGEEYISLKESKKELNSNHYRTDWWN